MEINDCDAAKMDTSESVASQSSIISTADTKDPEFESLSVSENLEKLSGNLLTNLQDNDCSVSSDKGTYDDQSQSNSNTNSNAKESLETEIPRSIFHLSDNMKKDLSMLAFPSKSHSRKKTVISSRTTPISRITIAEALGKAEDARRSMSNLHESSNRFCNSEKNFSKLPSQYLSTDKTANTGARESEEAMRILPHGDLSNQSKEIRNLGSPVTCKTVADSSPPHDTAEAASHSKGKTVTVGRKAKSPGTSRIQMTRRMCEVLKFTFIHEHFPSSVHMARLAKMMGLPWSQVRNWFTDRRVDNKKAGLYPRDKPLLHCPYCDVTLETEADQKTHLFSTHHVRKILGAEYCGGDTSESIKWKKLPKTVNAVSKMSGARILAVGFSPEDKKAAPKTLQEKKTVEPIAEEVPRSKELKKLWTEAMLLPQEKEPPLVEWNSVRFNQENNSDNKCDPFKQEGKDKNSFDLTTQEEKDKVLRVKNLENLCEKKVVSNSRAGSIFTNVNDALPGTASDNSFAMANNFTPLTGDVMGRSTSYSPPLNPSIISEEMSRNPSARKSQNYQDISLRSELETSKNISDFRKTFSTGIMIESPMESTVSTGAPHKPLELNFPDTMKPRNKYINSSWRPDSISHEKLTKSSTFASQLLQDIELKQESESDELQSHMNNITLYKADRTDAPEKYELGAINTNRQPVTISQNSAINRPYSSRSSHLIQKNSFAVYQPQIGKSGIKLTVNKVPRAVGKRKLKLQTQPLPIASKTRKASIPIDEGNLIVGYQCPTCNKIYQTEWLMMKHSATHFKYHCDICYQIYPDETMMKIHLLDHLSGAYEDEKYYCQFSCKVCHSLKCGCYEPTYCKPKDLPRIFFRPQKAKRSKRGFTSKLNSGPNDHLKISLATYKKLLTSGDTGHPRKEITVTSTSSKSTDAEDTQKVTLLQDSHKSAVVDNSQIPKFVIKETKVSNTEVEVQSPLHMKRDHEFLNTNVGTSSANSPQIARLDASTDIPVVQLEVRPNNNVMEGTNVAKEKQLNWNEVRTKFTFISKSQTNSQSKISKSSETGEGKVARKAGGRKRTPKGSKNFTYQDTDFYYMCEICDASFTTKNELSEHTFLHRLKSRSRRGEKRSISSVVEEKEFPQKIRVQNIEDKASSETVSEGFNKYKCELCCSIFPTAADYRAHKILAHKESKIDDVPQSVEVYRCNYCEKIYRRRRELKRHLKRDCTCAPPSLKGILSGLSYSGNAIEDIHYTALKIDFDDKADTLSKSSGKCVKGPILCKYCSAVTKREAEMKRHIWKFCLKVPAAVVKKFMDGASLEELGFKYIKDDTMPLEDTDMDVSNNTNTEVSGRLNYVDGALGTPQSDLTEALSPNKTSSAKTKMSSVEANIEESHSAKQYSQAEIKDSSYQPEALGGVSMTQPNQTDVEPKADVKHCEIKHFPKETKIDSQSAASEAGQSSTSTSPLGSLVMQLPIVLPVMTASAKSKRPLVCGYCGIWYFREMAILKHMKERCIKIPELEKDLLKDNPVLCNVPQKAGGISAENGAVYKMVKLPEHLQNTPVPMPKDVSNEDIKELNANISPFNENAPAKSEATSCKKQKHTSLSSVVKEKESLSSSSTGIMELDSLLPTVVKEQMSHSSSCIVIKEQDNPVSASEFMKEDNLSSATVVTEQDSLTSSVIVKEQGSLSSSAVVKEQDNLSSSRVVTEQNSLSSSAIVKEQSSLSSSSAVVKGQDNLSSSAAVKEHSKSSSATIKEQSISLSSATVKEQDTMSSLPTVVKQDCVSSVLVGEVHSSVSSDVSAPLKLSHNTTSKKGPRCRRCHEQFNSQEALLAHSSVHHGPKKGFYKCKLCHSRLAKYKQLREHVWEHTNEYPYRCHLCEVKYRISDSLVEHLNTVHRFTSINEKNLYKWLPGRHGKYRDIKTKNSRCEEKLDDVDTNLDNLAEVMIITDKDICSKAVTRSKFKANDSKATKSVEKNKKLADNESIQERRKSRLKELKSRSDNSMETNTLHEQKILSNSGATTSTDSNVSTNEVRTAVNVEKVNSLPIEEQDTLVKGSEKFPCESVETRTELEENKYKGRIPHTGDFSDCISGSNAKKQNEIAVIGEVHTVAKVPEKDPQSGVDDDFTGEGLLQHVENLDSVVETVHLTDGHLS